METIRGKASLDIDFKQLNERLNGYSCIILDLGTGDGRYVHFLADKFPDHFVIGVDSCRENLREFSRAKLANALFVIASAQSLPQELNGLISHITINFPWGSLLKSLLSGDPALMDGLEAISQFSTSLDIRLNVDALAEAGTSLEHGAEQIRENMMRAGWQITPPALMDVHALRTFPTTWARRLAHGRAPLALAMSGHLIYRTQNVFRQVAHVQ